MTKVKVGEVKYVHRYTYELVKENYDCIFVFGDNLEGWGTAGTACIRKAPNVIGIPTKRKPSMKPNAFFSDRDDELEAVFRATSKVIEEYNKGKTIILPTNGIGTGLAKMRKFSPKIYKYLVKRLRIIEPNYLKGE